MSMDENARTNSAEAEVDRDLALIIQAGVAGDALWAAYRLARRAMAAASLGIDLPSVVKTERMVDEARGDTTEE